MMRKIPYIILISLFFLSSCTEKFYPEINSDISILVVDGKITNKPGPYEVKLFRTVDLNKTDTLSPERGATIVIYDNNGNSDVFWETLPGIYKTQNPNFKGQIGNTYWIEIQTISGEKYESNPETIQAEIIINSIYGEEGDILLPDANTIKAAKILFDAHDPTNKSSYLRWEYQESWEWRNPYFKPKSNNPSKICFPYQLSNDVHIFDGSVQDIKNFHRLNSAIINEDEVKLNYEYFINLSMYSVSFENYQFWRKIKESIQQNGGLYSVIPANTRGNICACDTKNPVLGFFEASSVNSMNASFSTQNFQMEFIDFPQDCNEIEMRFKDGRPDESKFHILRDYFEAETHVFIVRQNYCYDCNVKYSPNKPSFWP